MIRQTSTKAVLIRGVLLILLLSGVLCQAQGNSGENLNEDGIVVHIFHADMDDETWTYTPDEPSTNIPLSMAIWISVVLGIFVFMVIAVCCALFCKYSGRLSSNNHNVITSPIPIIVTPPSRTETESPCQNGLLTPDGYTNHGYGGSMQKNGHRAARPSTDVPPHYADLPSAPEKANLVFYSEDIPIAKLETPPPNYTTVSPFK